MKPLLFVHDLAISEAPSGLQGVVSSLALAEAREVDEQKRVAIAFWTSTLSCEQAATLTKEGNFCAGRTSCTSAVGMVMSSFSLAISGLSSGAAMVSRRSSL